MGRSPTKTGHAPLCSLLSLFAFPVEARRGQLGNSARKVKRRRASQGSAATLWLQFYEIRGATTLIVSFSSRAAACQSDQKAVAKPEIEELSRGRCESGNAIRCGGPTSGSARLLQKKLEKNERHTESITRGSRNGCVGCVARASGRRRK